MKRLLTIVLLVFFSLNGWNQGPSLSDHDMLDAYMEKRQAFKHSSTKEFSADEQKELDRLENLLKDNFPESYAYHYVRWINGNYDLSRKDNLFKAYKLQADSREIQEEMFAYYAITNNAAKQKEFANKLKRNYSGNRINYYRDLLPDMGILITSGKEDSYPLYILQLIHNEGRGILVANMEWMKNDKYKQMVQRESGLGNIQFLGNEKNYLQSLMAVGKKRVIVSATVHQNYLSRSSGQIYLTGLGYEFHPRDQYKSLNDFWGKLKKRSLAELNLSGGEKRLYANYLPAMLTLYKLKLLNGREEPLLKSAIKVLANKVNKTKTVKEILEEYEISR